MVFILDLMLLMIDIVDTIVNTFVLPLQFFEQLSLLLVFRRYQFLLLSQFLVHLRFTLIFAHVFLNFCLGAVELTLLVPYLDI